MKILAHYTGRCKEYILGRASRGMEMKTAASRPASGRLVLLAMAIFVAAGAGAENVIHQFKGQPNDGATPLAGLTYWKTNYYGTTSTGGLIGGLSNYGTVIVMTPPSSLGGSWSESVLYSFQSGNDGQGPRARVIFD